MFHVKPCPRSLHCGSVLHRSPSPTVTRTVPPGVESSNRWRIYFGSPVDALQVSRDSQLIASRPLDCSVCVFVPQVALLDPAWPRTSQYVLGSSGVRVQKGLEMPTPYIDLRRNSQFRAIRSSSGSVRGNPERVSLRFPECVPVDFPVLVIAPSPVCSPVQIPRRPRIRTTLM